MQREVQPWAWIHSLLHPLLSFLLLAQHKVFCFFLPDQLTLSPITSYPLDPGRGNWTSGCKPSDFVQPSSSHWLSFLPATSPHAPNFTGLCINLINSLPVWIPEESVTSLPQLITYHQQQPSASRLWGCKYKYVKGLDPEHKCGGWAGKNNRKK